MTYRVRSGEHVCDAVRRIAHEQIEKAIDAIGDGGLEGDETVHQVRRRCKKVRGLLRLVRPAFEGTYRKENGAFRDSARRLSSLRDAASVLECFDALVKRYAKDVDTKMYEDTRVKLELHYAEINRDFDRNKRLEGFLDDMKAASKRVAHWSFDGGDFDAVAAGVKKTYKRGAKAMKIAREDPTDTVFHQWRKRVKYHWYHMRLLRDLWDPVIGARAAALDRLSDLLGDHHDLAVLRRVLGDLPERFGQPGGLVELADARRAELQAWAHPLGQRIYAETPSQLARRLESYWHAWVAEQQLEGALPAASVEMYS